MPIDLSNLTTQKVANILRGARIISLMPVLNGVVLDLELAGEEHVAVAFQMTQTPNGPAFHTNIAEL